ncbi:MAG: DUF1292 domain-containing protein [Syntrophomonadaceae bacterium]|jgi:uncharacterized protein YrzB (UPF0473 family)|nr:DUF1292 domain-containing protein [Bacillota bacterium]NLM87797.1 DUF1292 domain-containing protein [Syntrophomonadaceae bacterium]HAA09576.1 DUF1292 domain-containing protein [Syntrophomonas sp.]HQA49450.1 DUF1292 domain-containing protein [Syntrophomonadaceae bacterium]HQD90750.1 DUF1292 domain-containing protein [Syntrophomonadaceae bacterium]
MANEEIFDEEYPILVLVDEEGVEHSFELLAELEIEQDVYRVLIPLDEEETADEDEDIEVIILKVVHDEEGNEFLSDIEDDEEWERVADAWQELVESEDL